MDKVLNAPLPPVGPPLPAWEPPLPPAHAILPGLYCRLEPLDPKVHALELYESYFADTSGRLWTYLPYGPFDSFEQFCAWLKNSCLGEDPLFFAVIDLADNRASGMSAFMRISPDNGVIELGHINFAPCLKRTTAATEAIFLMLRSAFSQGYRRCEWKCDSLNAPSKAAAQRLGFSFEGLFRNAAVYKGRNRDTAWYSIIDSEWPQLQEAYGRWLDPANFDGNGKQHLRLSELTAPLLKNCLRNDQQPPQPLRKRGPKPAGPAPARQPR